MKRAHAYIGSDEERRAGSEGGSAVSMDGQGCLLRNGFDIAVTTDVELCDRKLLDPV